jgi:sRNA-binding carbon storage regulator CsrA
MGIATDVEGNQSGELPVRVKILRRELVQKVEEQTTGENTQYSDQRTQDQSSQLADKKIKQKDVEHMSFGA